MSWESIMIEMERKRCEICGRFYEVEVEVVSACPYHWHELDGHGSNLSKVPKAKAKPAKR